MGYLHCGQSSKAGRLQQRLIHVGVHGLLRNIIFAVKIDVFRETGAAIEGAHSHAAFQNETARSLAHQQSNELHLSPVSEFCLRTEAEVTCCVNRISTLVSI